MPSKPLAGKTIFLTGTKITKAIQGFIEENGGRAFHFPLIETVERESPQDEIWLERLTHYDWMIFTSQMAVECFHAKCIRHQIDLTSLSHQIAAVGDKTAEALQQIGLAVHFIPSTFSADVFVQEFQMAKGEQALFVRGSMAKQTIRDGVGADEWTVYETQNCLIHVNEFEKCLIASAEPIVVFASPSAVEVYAKYIVPNLDWRFIKVASIGHITTEALATYGVTPHVQPKTYTMKAVIEQLIMEDIHHE